MERAQMKRNAHTVLELLVVLLIIATLIGLIVPAVQRARDTASRAMSANNLKEISLANQHYAAVHAGRLPSTWDTNMGIFNLLLPYLDQSNFSYSEMQAAAANGVLQFPPFVSPSDPTVKPDSRFPTSYGPNAQVFVRERRLDASFPDGTSNTIAFAEQYYHCGNRFSDLCLPNIGFAFGYPGQDPTTFQVRPSPGACRSDFAQTPFQAGLVVGLADGSVRTISPTISYATYWAAISPAGGETLGGDWDQ